MEYANVYVKVKPVQIPDAMLLSRLSMKQINGLQLNIHRERTSSSLSPEPLAASPLVLTLTL